MRRALIATAALLLLASAAGGGWLLWQRHLADQAHRPLVFQGYVEGELLFIGPEEGGRIERLAVREGDRVEAGAPLFSLDTVLQEAQRAEAEARLAQARAQLANLRAAQSRPEQIAVLRAAEERARAALDYSRAEYERQRALAERGIAARARLDQAAADYERDRAALEEARRQIEAAQLAGRSAEIAAAEAAARAAGAALRHAEARLAKRAVAAPAAGMVQEVYFRPGEAVAAGQPVLALLPPDNRKLRFYVPEPLYTSVPLGSAVTVTCDGCGRDGLPAQITFASREVEFTPPVIFSQEERARLVFRLEARLEGEAARLPLGLPVTVRLRDATPVAEAAPR